jgi:hypothetical protein
MAFSETALKNVEPMRHTGRHEIMWLPGDPGVTFTKGELCSLSGGVLIRGTDSAANAVFRVEKTTVSPAATQAFPLYSDVWPRREASKDLTLVPVQVMVAGGAPVLIANVTNYQDETVVSYTASTRAVAMTTGFGADDRSNSGLAYIYEGPGLGEMNIIEDYDHTGGAAELLAIFHRAFATTLTTSSKMIVLSSTSGANAVGPFGRVDLSDEDQIDCNDGADDGDYVIFGDWQTVGTYLRLGQLPIINRMALYS